VEEVKRIEQERMIDETLYSSQRKQHLRKIKEMSQCSQELVDLSAYEEQRSPAGGEGGL